MCKLFFDFQEHFSNFSLVQTFKGMQNYFFCKFIFQTSQTTNFTKKFKLCRKLVQNKSVPQPTLSEKAESHDKWDSFDHKYLRKPFSTTCTLRRNSWRKIPRNRRDLCLQIARRRMAKRSSLGPSSCWFINTSAKTTMKAHLMSIFDAMHHRRCHDDGSECEWIINFY